MFGRVLKDSKSALTLFLLFGFIGITIIEALQCYDCYDCEYGEDLNELQICGELPVMNKPTRRTTTTTTSIKSTTQSTLNKNSTTTPTRPSNITTSAPGKGDDQQNIVVVANKTTLRPGNLINSNKTTKIPADDSEEYEDNGDDDYDDDERRFRHRNQRMSSRVDDAVCYVVQLKVNGNSITKRGCTTLLYDDDTCKSLTFGYALEKCHLCETDGCNKFTDDDDSWEVLWNAGGRVNALRIWFILPLFILWRSLRN